MSTRAKSVSVTIVRDPEYFQALGAFIEKFAFVETVMFYLLAHYSKIDIRRARAVFSGVKADQSMDYIRRLIDVHNPGEETRQELEHAFTHLKAISAVRNAVVHSISFINADNVRVVSDIAKVHLEEKVKERPVSAALLDSMTTDLQRIGTQLILHFAKPDWSYAQRLETFPALKDAWLYKPPQDQSLRVKKLVEPGPRPVRAPRDPR